MCGFADHGHNVAPCPKCEVDADTLFSEASLKNGKVVLFLVKSNIILTSTQNLVLVQIKCTLSLGKSGGPRRPQRSVTSIFRKMGCDGRNSRDYHIST